MKEVIQVYKLYNSEQEKRESTIGVWTYYKKKKKQMEGKCSDVNGCCKKKRNG